MSALDTVTWLVALDGPDPGRVVRIGQRRALTLDGWFESPEAGAAQAAPDDGGVRGLMVWLEDEVVLIQDCLAPDTASAEGIDIGDDPVPLLCGDEFAFGRWRWRVVEMPTDVEPDPEEVRRTPRRAPLGSDRDTVPPGSLPPHASPPSGLPLDVTQPEPFARPRLSDAGEGTPVGGRVPYFIGVGGQRAGECFRLNEVLVFGRSPACDVLVDSRPVNRKHLRAWLEDDLVWISEMGGHNPAYLNGEVVRDIGRGNCVLEVDDLITLAGGRDHFVFKLRRQGDRPTEVEIAALITRWALQNAEQQRLTRRGRTRDR